MCMMTLMNASKKHMEIYGRDKCVKIGIHNGKFHADDVLCVSLIRYFITKDVEIVRTRDEEILNSCDFVLDVGEKDKITENQVCFDHHQEATKYYENGIAYAACGKLADYLLKDNLPLLDELRSKFLWPVEAVDNGQDTKNFDFPVKDNLLSFVQLMNCTWQEDLYGKEQDECFLRAVEISDTILSAFMKRYNSYRLAEEFVDEAIKKSKDNIIILDRYIGGWAKLICQHNAEHPESLIKVGIVKSKNDLYLAQAISISEDTYETYISFPWGGLSGAELSIASGIAGGVFCHKSGFLCGFTTYESAMMAVKKVLS